MPKPLRERLRERVRLQAERRKRQGRSSGRDWSGEYGYGAGRAHPSVEFAACPSCGSRPGRLCTGPMGPKLATHYPRRDAYRALVGNVATID